MTLVRVVSGVTWQRVDRNRLQGMRGKWLKSHTERRNRSVPKNSRRELLYIYVHMIQVRGGLLWREDTWRSKILEKAAKNGVQGSSHHFGLRRKQCWFVHRDRRKDRAHCTEADR